MKLRYTPAAIVDMEEIRSYIRDVLLNPDAAKNVLAAIATSCAKLKVQPYMGIELRKKLNRDLNGYCIIAGKYIVIYDVDESVSILRVLDTRTDYVREFLSEV